jgi:hypothetical protein
MYNVASDDRKMSHRVDVDADVPMTQEGDVLPFAIAERLDPNNSVLCCDTLLLH